MENYPPPSSVSLFGVAASTLFMGLVSWFLYLLRGSLILPFPKLSPVRSGICFQINGVSNRATGSIRVWNFQVAPHFFDSTFWRFPSRKPPKQLMKRAPVPAHSPLFAGVGFKRLFKPVNKLLPYHFMKMLRKPAKYPDQARFVEIVC